MDTIAMSIEEGHQQMKLASKLTILRKIKLKKKY